MGLDKQITEARRRALISWLMEPHVVGPPPGNTTLEEINEALDDIESRIEYLRGIYPQQNQTQKAINRIVQYSDELP